MNQPPPNPYAQFQAQQPPPAAAQPSYAPPPQAQFAAPPQPPPAYAPPPAAYPQAPAPAQPAYGTPPPGWGQHSGQGQFASVDDAQPGGSHNLFPQNVYSRFICQLNSFVERISPSRGSMGGPQRVATFTVVQSHDARIANGTRFEQIFRAGGNAAKPEAIANDLYRTKQLAAACFRLDPMSPQPQPGRQLQPGQKPWDAIIADLVATNLTSQPLYFELQQVDSGRPANDPQTRQPKGYNYPNVSYLPAPLPAQG